MVIEQGVAVVVVVGAARLLLMVEGEEFWEVGGSMTGDGGADIGSSGRWVVVERGVAVGGWRGRRSCVLLLLLTVDV